MAAKTTAAAAAPERPDPEELVTVTIPRSARAYKDEDAMFVSLNGESIRIKYGEPVKIKRKFAEIISRHLAQRDYAEDYARSIEFGAATPKS